ncbi:MAG TPA: prephenate dehydrogenase/arogenate dehydrogenase family protein [Atribacteraceae bacterium]|nr:prephenate dehydrogenase/arogenate dehydrogenase family protein [Atribacteraceae bacterium]
MEHTIGIIGLGLMGGSLGLAMSEWPGMTLVLGHDRDPKSARLAKERGAVAELRPTPEAVAETSDLLFLAVPVRSVPDVLTRAAATLKPHSIVFDLASSREWILRETGPLSDRINYAGFHPMCGKEIGGIGQARATLFRNAPILITPEKPPHRIAEMARRVSTFLGGRVFFCTPGNMTLPALWSAIFPICFPTHSVLEPLL